MIRRQETSIPFEQIQVGDQVVCGGIVLAEIDSVNNATETVEMRTPLAFRMIDRQDAHERDFRFIRPQRTLPTAWTRITKEQAGLLRPTPR